VKKLHLWVERNFSSQKKSSVQRKSVLKSLPQSSAQHFNQELKKHTYVRLTHFFLRTNFAKKFLLTICLNARIAFPICQSESNLCSSQTPAASAIKIIFAVAFKKPFQLHTYTRSQAYDRELQRQRCT
jgi:hypothetical protein